MSFIVESKDNAGNKSPIPTQVNNVDLCISSKVFDDLCGLEITSLNLLGKLDFKNTNALNYRLYAAEAKNGLFLKIGIGVKIILINYNEQEFHVKYGEFIPAGIYRDNLTIRDLFAALRWGYDFKEYYEW